MAEKFSDGRLLSRAEVQEHFGLTTRHLEDLAAKGQGPAFSKLGRMVRYRAGDVRDWIEAHQVVSPISSQGADRAEPCMKADLPLRIIATLKKDTAASADEVEALIAETDAACDAYAERTLALAEMKLTDRNTGPRLSKIRQDFEEARSMEDGLERCLSDLRALHRKKQSAGS
ncbi:AlpA family transcriptional regulator [Pseudoruegeria sp. HB172150]|uniref:helix-turn-helix transcriptional regulator n=1 Tax=Pseudoruegeria sp. HB172150 TaxID=2721164 RepID=UPI0015520D07|nr:helix-turn-helix domain-containing protein [Pseudoruegeria sp. HB172150]